MRRMGEVTAARILCIMGSGETAPTMAPVHRELIERVGGEGARAALIDTPFGFQENADELVAKAQEYFQRSIVHPLELASLRRAETASEVEKEAAYSRIHEADYVFSGPGSPSYTLRECRIYVRGIIGGKAQHHLMPEEAEALQQALSEP